MRKLLAIPILASLMACQGTDHKSADKNDTPVVADAGKNGVTVADDKKMQILQHYIHLKDALVKSDGKEAQLAAEKLKLSLKEFPGCEPTAELAQHIAGGQDLKTQRKSFTVLSADIIALFKNAEVKNGTLYVQHCPMANQGDGGDWLSTERVIRNPYYGNEMLECGNVLEEIKAK